MNIIELAKEAGLPGYPDELERFAALVLAKAKEEALKEQGEQFYSPSIANAIIRAKALEEAAKVCDLVNQGGIGDIGDDGAELCAIEIRKLNHGKD